MTSSALDLSDRICRHIAETPIGAIPATARNAAARALLDATGVMLAASGLSAEAAPFVDLARQSGAGRCDVLGTGAKTGAAMAAFANGAMAHALDFEDAFDRAPSHPNASLIPAAIAMAQAAGPVDGETFLSALAIGCDLVCRMGLSLTAPMEDHGWYPPPLLGAFGAAAGAARIAGLGAEQTRDTLSLMLCQAGGPGEIKHSADTVIRAVREAFPAQAAVQAVQLARAGVRGFETPLEGQGGFFRLYAQNSYAPEVLLDGLGQRYFGEELSFKAWPACRGTHAFIEIALDLKAKYGFGWEDVEALTATIGEVQRMLVEPVARKRRPATAIDAKFSIPFTVALALVRGGVGLDDFDAAALADSGVLAMADKVGFVENPDWGRAEASAGALKIRLKDGRELEGEVAQALGHPARPLSDQALIEKFVACSARAANRIGPDEARSKAGLLLAIEAQPDVGALFA